MGFVTRVFAAFRPIQSSEKTVYCLVKPFPRGLEGVVVEFGKAHGKPGRVLPVGLREMR
jgi:hypothetical protein